ncbi:MAG: DUF308 domain-containing protein [Candidatus Lokiarchaeota archaeon]|nr:DUF308 domain-containing protein [Candidatus Lokiarchaeota archaeon]
MVYLSNKNFNIISGIIIIFLSILLLIYSAAAVVSILAILAVIMLFVGTTQLLNAKSDDNLEGTNLVIKYLMGVFELIMGIFLIISLITDPIATAVFSIRLLGFVILLVGLAMLYIGLMNHEYRKEYRYILMVIGLITIIFGVLILAIPTVGINIIAILVAFPLLFVGLTRLLKGILT